MSLIIERISKTYSNGVRALDEINLTIPTGMFGLLGPNGAGKSSLMRTLATLQVADSGLMKFNEIDIVRQPVELRKVLGYLPQDFGVYDGESAESLLDYFALLKGIPLRKQRSILVDKVLELTHLSEARHAHVSSYSGGMKRRFGIAQLLLNDPKLIIVDEPTAGLDPAERTRFLNVLRSLGDNSTIIFSTHLVADVSELCQQFAIVEQGRVLLEDTTRGSVDKLEGKVWRTAIHPESLQDYSTKFKILSSSYQSNEKLSIRAYFEEPPSNIPSWELVNADLGDVYFLSLSKKTQTHV